MTTLCGSMCALSASIVAGIALEILMEIGFQEVVNEGDYDALFEKQGLNEK